MALKSQTIINPTAPTTALKIYVMPDGQFQVEFNGVTNVYAPGTTAPGGTLFNGLVAALGTTTVGSTSGTHFTGSIDNPWTSCGIDPVPFGSGTSADPWSVDVCLYYDIDSDNAQTSADLSLTWTVSYVDGDEYFLNEYLLVPPAGNVQTVKLYHIVDTYLGGDDTGGAWASDDNCDIANPVAFPDGTSDASVDPGIIGVLKNPGLANEIFMGMAEFDGEFSHWYSGDYNSDDIIVNGFDSGGDIITGYEVASTTDHGFAIQYSPSTTNVPVYYSNYYTFTLIDICTIVSNPCAGGVPPSGGTTEALVDCPALTADLTGISFSNIPSGQTLTWHNNSLADGTDLVADITSVSPGTYFASYFNSGTGCYGPSSTFTVVDITNCTDSDLDGIIDIYDEDDDNDGVLDIYEVCQPISLSVPIEIAVDLDTFEPESSWELLDPNGVVVASGGSYGEYDDLVGTTYTTLQYGTYVFRMLDSFSDGLNGAGGSSDENGTSGFSVDYNSTNLYTSPNDFNFGAVYEVEIVHSPYGCFSTDPNEDDDGDGIYNYQDADYAAANGDVLNGAGVLSTFDLDGDGLINSLDLETDNDACFDAIEGAASFTFANGQVDGSGMLNGPVDSNGIPVIATSSGQLEGDSQDAGTQSADCCDLTNASLDCDGDGINNGTDCDPADPNELYDSDGDGYCNNDDLDDDNDGLFDSEECGIALTNSLIAADGQQDGKYPFAFWDAEYFEGFYGIQGSTFGSSSVDNNGSGSPGNPIYLGEAYFGVNALTFSDSRFFASGTAATTAGQTPSGYVGANSNASYYQIQFNRKADRNGTLDFGGSGNFDDVIEVFVNGSQVLFGSGCCGAPVNPGSTAQSIPFSQNDSIQLRYTNLGGQGSYNFSFVMNYGCDEDVDGDGLPNSLDSDTDGDGCLDTQEAGFTDADQNGEVDGTAYAADGTVIGSDGYTGSDPLVTDPTMMTAACDTDGDGVSPLVDLDDDNDGLFDTEEIPCVTSSTSAIWYHNSGVTGDNSDPVFTSVVYDETYGAGFSSTQIISTYLELNGVDALNYSEAMANDEYVEYSVLTNASFSDDYYLNQFRLYHQSSSLALGYKFAIALSDDGFVTSELLLLNEIMTAGPGYVFHDAYELYYNLLPATTYTFRVYVYDTPGANAGQCVLDDFRFDICSGEYDVDGDGIFNHIDADSDGDGCLDAIEAGYSDANQDGEVDGTGYNVDGTVQGSDGYTGNDPLVTDPTMMTAACDTDGDGISPLTDIDDDNDGIADLDECPVADGTELIYDQRTGQVLQPLDVNTTGTVTGGTISSSSGILAYLAPETAASYTVSFSHPLSFVELHFGSVADISEIGNFTLVLEDATILTNVDFELTFAAQQDAFGALTLEAGGDSNFQKRLVKSIGSPFAAGVHFVDNPVTSGPQNWGILLFNGYESNPIVSITYEINSGGSNHYVGFVGLPVLDCDSDDDGVDDQYDLDSDNDGIYDVVEGGDNDSDTNGDGAVNSSDTGFSDTDDDGMDDTSEGTTPTDSDSDGNLDSTELDSDDDGCNDVIEAGYLDPDGNGLIGSGN